MVAHRRLPLGVTNRVLDGHANYSDDEEDGCYVKDSHGR